MNFLKCQHCQAKDIKCPVCHGWRIVLPLAGRILYWQKKVSWGYIYNQRILKTIRKTVDAVLYVFVALILIMVMYFLYRYLEIGGEVINFFLKKHLILKFFWLAALAGLYIFYRMSSEKVSEKKVIKKYEEDEKDKNKRVIEDLDDVWQLNSSQLSAEKINVAQAFSFQALKLIEQSYLLSLKLNHQLQPVHIFYELLSTRDVRGYFFRLGIDTKQLQQRLEDVFRRIKKNTETPRGVSLQTIKVFLLAYQEAYQTSQPVVGVEEILISLVKHQSIVQQILFDLEIDQVKIRNIIEWARIQKRLNKYWRQLQSRAVARPKGEINRAYTATASPFLDQFSEDLTQYARAGYLEPGIGKEKELKTIFNFFNAGKSGVVLVGQRGTGKSFVVDALAELMAAETVPKILQDKRLVRLSISALIAGASAPGAIEARLLQVLKEIRRAGNIILVIDNIDSLVGLSTETSESFDLAELLAGELEKGYFLLVAVADLDKYKAYLKTTSLATELAEVEIKEPERNDAIRILETKAPFLESKYRVFFSYQALEAAVDFSAKYIHNQFLPAKAVDLIERTAQFARQNKGEKTIILAEDIAQVVSEITKIPVTKVTKIESQKLLHLEQEMHRRVVDQQEAVNFVAQALRRARARLREDKRPIASFLFLGPTGVGKTEVARTLSEIYFGGEENIIRLDMSEYGAIDALPKLIGEAGSNQAGYLTERVKERPFALVLLDEFEKASLEVHNLFLQVMEDGRLTDALGQTVDFTNTIIISTSNAGTSAIQQGLKSGKGLEDIKRDLIERYLGKYFKPELINRFDGVVVFKPLSPGDVKKITELMFNRLGENLAEKGIEFKYTEQAVEEVALAGFDPAFGARPLRRVIQDKIENQIANLILAGKVKRRDKIILQSIDDVRIEKAVII